MKRKPIDNEAIDKIELRPDAWERFERKLKEWVIVGGIVEVDARGLRRWHGFDAESDALALADIIQVARLDLFVLGVDFVMIDRRRFICHGWRVGPVAARGAYF